METDKPDYNEYELEEQLDDFCITHGNIACSHCGNRIAPGEYVYVLGDMVFCNITCVFDYVGARDLGFCLEGVPEGDEYRKLFPEIKEDEHGKDM